MTDNNCFELEICKWGKGIVRSKRGRQRLAPPQQREEDRKWGGRGIGRWRSEDTKGTYDKRPDRTIGDG
jgi:hypothetical protein